MRDLRGVPFDGWRRRDRIVVEIFGSLGDETCGAFLIPGRVKLGGYIVLAPLNVIATAADGWDHVSISARGRCPTWNDMAAMHRLFFAPDEVAYQLHVPAAEHVNGHPHTLHIWRAWQADPPLPPPHLVGLSGVDAAGHREVVATIRAAARRPG